MPVSPHTVSDEARTRSGSYDWRLLLRFGRFARPFAGLMAAAAILSIVSAALELAGPHIVQRILDTIHGPEGTIDLSGVDRWIGLWLGIVGAGFILNVGIMLLVTWTAQSAMLAMRHEIFCHLQTLDVQFFDRNRVGRLLTRVMSDVAAFNELLAMGIPTFFRDVFVLGGIVVVLFLTDWRLACVVSVCFPLVLAATWAFSRAIRVFYRRTRKHLAVLNGFLQENLSGMLTVQLFGREQENHAQFRGLNAQLRDAHLGTVFIFSLLFPILEIIAALGVALILWYGGIRLIASDMTFGVLTAFMLYLKRFIMPIRDLAEKFNMVESAMASAERINDLLETKPRIVDPPNPKPHRALRHGVTFDGVWFAYNEGEWILKDVNLSVERGQTVAIVGATGAGKSTVINTLLRLYDVGRGSIKIDGIDLRDMAQQALRRRIAVVLQDVVLFRGSIADNIRLGRPDLSGQEVRRAAETVHADSFIRALPGGYEHEILEAGATLSVGQKQLLAFARALAVSPEILILDEATSNIDAETEALIQDALLCLLEGRTAVVIAHRLSTIQRAEKIVVLHHGRVREEGTHAELIAREGIYQRLCQLQTM